MVYNLAIDKNASNTNMTTYPSLIPLYRLLIISTLLAIVTVLCYSWLPERRERILPDQAQNHYIYHDGQVGGKMTAEWVNEKKFIFKCTHTPGGTGWSYCGMRVNLGSPTEGKDFSKYQRLETKMNYQGNNRHLRMSLNNFNPKYAKTGNEESAKALDVYFLADEAHGVISINSHEWRASEHWVQTNNIPRALSYGEFNNIIGISVDLFPPIAEGDHIIEIEYIDVYGELLAAETWYLGVALLWLFTNLLVIGRHLYIQETRISADSSRLTMLSNYTNSLQEESQKYKVLSSTDPLTGALNRNGFAEEMMQSFPDGKLSTNTALILIDIDHFKKINDTRGHDAGDAILREVASVIRHNVLGSDKLIRWGGEEFMLLCKETNQQGALLVAEKVRTAIEQMKIIFNGDVVAVTISLGVGIVKPQESFDELFRRTDEALYKAKQQGRNCVVLAG